MPSIQITDCVLKLADAWLDLKAIYEREHPDRKLMLTATYRSPEEQFTLFQQGRRQIADGTWIVDEDPKTSIVTQLDGYKKRSKHNSRPAGALDFCVVVVGKVSWDIREYAAVGVLAEARGLVWGGRWTSIVDAPHLEIPVA